MIIILTKAQLALFETPVHVGAHVRKDGTVVKPHIRIQKVAPKKPVQQSMFGGEDEAPKPKRRTKLDAFIDRHGGLSALASKLAGMTEGQQQQIFEGMARISDGKTVADIAAMFDGVKPTEPDLFSAPAPEQKPEAPEPKKSVQEKPSDKLKVVKERLKVPLPDYKPGDVVDKYDLTKLPNGTVLKVTNEKFPDYVRYALITRDGVYFRKLRGEGWQKNPLTPQQTALFLAGEYGTYTLEKLSDVAQKRAEADAKRARDPVSPYLQQARDLFREYVEGGISNANLYDRVRFERRVRLFAESLPENEVEARKVLGSMFGGRYGPTPPKPPEMSEHAKNRLQGELHRAVRKKREDAQSDSTRSHPIASDSAPEIVEHVTKRGKTLRGIIRRDLTLKEAKQIDPYTFKKDGGYFIRERHVLSEKKDGIEIQDAKFITPRIARAYRKYIEAGGSETYFDADGKGSYHIEDSPDHEGIVEFGNQYTSGNPRSGGGQQIFSTKLYFRKTDLEAAISNDKRSKPKKTQDAPAHDSTTPFGVAAGTSKGKRREINARVVDLLRSGKTEFSDEDKDLLRQYSGTGGIGDSLNEFYTDPAVARSMWSLLKKLGFETGTVLEPSCGTGVFMHTAPEGVRITGVEMDPISSKAAEVLHGDRHEVANASFERFVTQDGDRKFDAVIGNPPFGLRGSLLKDDKPDLKTAEAYFLDTAIDKVKPGGIVAMIVPTGVLDARSNRSLRERLLRKAEFLGAMRMPNTAFEHAHTGVTTDIVVFRKRPDDVGQALMTVDQETLKRLGVWDEEYLSGSYFEGRGAGSIFGTMEAGWRAKAGIGQDITVSGSMQGVPEAIEEWAPDDFSTANPTVPDILEALGDDEAAKQRALGAAMRRPDGPKVGDTKVVDGVTYILQGEPPRWHRVDEFMQDDAISSAQEIALDIDRLFTGEAVDRPALEKRIQEYVEKHGIPGKNSNLHLAAKHDKRLYRLIGAVGEDGSLSDAVTGRQRDRVRGTLETVAQSLALERIDGAFSPAEIAERTGKDADEVEDILVASNDYAYLGDGQWTTFDQYLTGDLWPKLDQVREQAKRDDLPAGLADKYKLQEERLEEAIDPKSLEDVEIMINSGFIPTEVLEAFFNDYKRERGLENEWIRSQPDYSITYDGGLYTIEGGLYDRELLSKYLNRTGVRKDDLPTIEKWNENFKQWLLSSRYRDQIEDLYNRKFRGFVQREFSNDPIDIPGMVTEGLKDYQYGGVRWAIAAGKGIIAADVGLGKTVRALMIARMAKINGTAQKPTFVVPKSVLANWVAEAEKWFPGSRVMVIGETYTRDKDGNLKSKSDSAAVRNRKLHELTQNDYDFVFISQPAFNDIDLDPITKGKYIEDDFWVQRGDKLGQAGDKRTRKIREAYEQAIAGREFQKRTDAIYFNELGIDMLVVDEAHSMKNLYAARNRFGETPKFLGGQGLSNRALDMNLKSRWVLEQNGGNGVYMLTATPTKNSPLEIYSMLSHIAPEAFERIGIRNSEEFLDRYCDFQQGKVLGTDGTIEDALITAGFKNLDELREIMQRYIDRKTAADVGLKLPERDDRMHMIDMTPQQQEVYENLRQQLEEVATKRDATGDAHVFSIMDKMAKAAMDLELLGPEYAGAQSPKYMEAAKQIAEGAKDGGQVVFCESIASHEKLADALVSQGIPRDQIAIINAQATPSSARRQNISDQFNAGKIKVVIGNKTMEEGMNLQKSTTDIHHLDLPWEPAAMQQRNGRGLRQGNINEAVRIHTYISKGSFDGYRYQSMMAKKDWQDILWNGGDRVENLAREGSFDRTDLLIMMSADPEAERAKLEADKAAAQERYDAEKRREAASEFTRFQVMKRSYRDLKNKKSKSAERLRARIERTKAQLQSNKYFSAKDALDSDTPVVIQPDTGIALHSNVGLDIPEKDGSIVKWVVTDVDPTTGDVSLRRYGEIGKSAVKIRVPVHELNDVKAFDFNEAKEAKEIKAKIESDAKNSLSSVSSLKDLRSIPSSVLEENKNTIQERIKQNAKAYKFDFGYGRVAMVDRESGELTVAESYEHIGKHETHDYLLPTDENRKKAIEAYIADQQAKRFDYDYVTTRRGSRSTRVMVEKYPGGYSQKTNRWADAGKSLFGDEFEREARAAFDRVQGERIRRAPSFTEALREAAPTVDLGHSAVPRWPRRTLAILFARAKREGLLNADINSVEPTVEVYGSKRAMLPADVWKYGSSHNQNIVYGPVGERLIKLAEGNGHADLAAAMVISSADPKQPEETVKRLLKIRDWHKGSVAEAIRHMIAKHPEIGDKTLKELDLHWLPDVNLKFFTRLADVPGVKEAA